MAQVISEETIDNNTVKKTDGTNIILNLVPDSAKSCQKHPFLADWNFWEWELIYNHPMPFRHFPQGKTCGAKAIKR